MDNSMNQLQEIPLRLKELRLANNLEQIDVAKYLGYKSDSTISKWENGKNLPKGAKLVQLAKLFGTSTDYILHGQQKGTTSSAIQKTEIQQIYDKLHPPRQEKVLTYAEDQYKEQEAEISNKVIEINEKTTEYHVFEKLSAGNGYDYMEDRNYDVVFFNKDIDHDFASWVYGDSMEPKYLSGSVALIKDTGWDYDGAVYAVDWDGQSYIKKVYKEKDGLRLVSLNDKYDDKFAKWEEEPRIIGKVVGNFMPVGD
ncbi:TPA: XRE family transcriptional regulator [Streptococcus pyogenes]